MLQLQCALFGDQGVGKTCFLFATRGLYPSEAERDDNGFGITGSPGNRILLTQPGSVAAQIHFSEFYSGTANKPNTMHVTGNSTNWRFNASSSAVEEMRRLDCQRVLTSVHTYDVIMLCFSPSRPGSLANVTSKWLPFFKAGSYSLPPVLLVGLGDDRPGADAMHVEAAAASRNLGFEYAHCNYLDAKSIEDVLSAAVRQTRKYRAKAGHGKTLAARQAQVEAQGQTAVMLMLGLVIMIIVFAIYKWLL